MRQARALGEQGLLLCHIGAHLVHIGHQPLERLALVLRALAPLAGLLHLAIELREAAAHAAQAGLEGHGIRSGEGIEDRHLRGRPHQAPLLMLAREAHQAADEGRNALA